MHSVCTLYLLKHFVSQSKDVNTHFSSEQTDVRELATVTKLVSGTASIQI